MSSANVWNYRDTLSSGETTSDFAGYDVVATDGGIGKIDEAATATSRNYLVVDTGFWIFGKKRLIPAGVVTRVDRDDRVVYVNMTKDQIKQAPDYDEQMLGGDDAYYDKHASYYDSYGW
jgi:hypothetical protein